MRGEDEHSIEVVNTEQEKITDKIKLVDTRSRLIFFFKKSLSM